MGESEKPRWRPATYLKESHQHAELGWLQCTLSDIGQAAWVAASQTYI